MKLKIKYKNPLGFVVTKVCTTNFLVGWAAFAIWLAWLGLVAIFLYFFYLYICWTDGNLEYVVSAIKDRSIIIPFWISAICTLLMNGFSLLFNIVCEIVKL
jgi:hypothetical protein